MKRTLPILLLLTACASTTPSEQATNAAQQSIANLSAQVSALPAECHPEVITKQLSAIEAQVKLFPALCKAEKKPIEKDVIIWQLVSSILGLALGSIFLLKLKKYFI